MLTLFSEAEEKQKWKYTQPCIYCGKVLNLNSAGGEIGIHHCEVGKDIWKKMKVDQVLNNKQHNMFIHGFLQAVQIYVSSFGLLNTAAEVLRSSGIDKEDLIRCQIESNWQSEIILPLIEKAFNHK